jgi:Flp pilus assembly protein TadG
MRKERGQALVLGLVVLFFGTITLFYMFSTGQISADKERVTNAADAAAYSTALWRARALNYDAYANRAMIANEVAIAQTMTLVSEAQYLKNFAACLSLQSGDTGVTCKAHVAYIVQFVPYFSAIASYIYDVLYYAETPLSYALEAEVETRSRGMNQALLASQEALMLSTNFLPLEKLADQIASLNDSHFRARMLPDNFEGPDGFTKRYTGADRQRSANIVRASLDGYTQNRGYTHRLDLLCIGYRYQKRGGTTLDAGLERWEATDTLSEWQFKPKLFGCDRKEEKMAWGERQASGGTSNQDTGKVGDNPKARSEARSSANYDAFGGGPRRPDGYVGIQPLIELNYSALTHDDADVRNPFHQLAVVVMLDKENVRTANTLNIGVGRLRMTEKMDHDRLSTVSAAQVYFKRPAARTDGAIEYPSLFNPYWQARLAEPTLAQRAAALLY